MEQHDHRTADDTDHEKASEDDEGMELPSANNARSVLLLVTLDHHDLSVTPIPQSDDDDDDDDENVDPAPPSKAQVNILVRVD